MVRKKKLLLLQFMAVLSIIVTAANMTLIVTAAPGTTIYVDPASIVDLSLVPTSTFNVNVTVREATDVYLWDFKLSFDAALLECVDAVEPYPPGDQIWVFYIEEIDNLAGTVHVVGHRPFGIKVGLDGTWKLATLVFSVKADGSGDLTLTSSQIRDSGNNRIDPDMEDGFFSNVTPPKHDVAVTIITASPTTVTLGDLVTINVTVANEGDFAETFDLVAYYDSVSISTESVSLSSGATETVTFTWDTTDVHVGEYTISANATTVEDEDDTDDNVKIFGTEITIVGHDIVVAHVTVSPTTVAPGDSVTLTVIVENDGSYSETFNVTVYYDGNVVETQTGVVLGAEASDTLTFTWDTAGIAEGTYDLKAEASVVEHETETDNNTFLAGEVTVQATGSQQAFPVELIAIAGFAVAAAIAGGVLFYRRRKPAGP